jgi:hypothetical protein
MAIDLSTERPFPLAKAAKHQLFRGKSRDGRSLNFSTVWRWALNGIRGVKLETVRVGNTLCTTEPAMQRFIERLSNPDAGDIAETPAMRRRAHEAAVKELAAAGATA